MDVYKSLNSYKILSFTEQFPEVAEVNVCVGKEWHRFPSSFFLPNNKSVLFASLLHIRSTVLVCVLKAMKCAFIMLWIWESGSSLWDVDCSICVLILTIALYSVSALSNQLWKL